MDHPGWKNGGTVIRRFHNGEKTYLLHSDGALLNISTYQKEWVFNATDEKGNSCEIRTLSTDIYIPPKSERTHAMLTRNWIVVSSINGPSSNPTKYTSEESAIEEAKRLALKNPSAQFYVYELKRAYQVETVKEIEVRDILF